MYDASRGRLNGAWSVVQRIFQPGYGDMLAWRLERGLPPLPYAQVGDLLAGWGGEIQTPQTLNMVTVRGRRGRGICGGRGDSLQRLGTAWPAEDAALPRPGVDTYAVHCWEGALLLLMLHKCCEGCAAQRTHGSARRRASAPARRSPPPPDAGCPRRWRP